ncbi:hypothetical protein [Arenimonas oryziterrae]|uniref:hypothetical protein n=1 Tax=Arenimonas oryziterrae TaxID=498055 RepID=UPI0012DD4DEE|nr:hypothetical protein [Arenimonas oryziterrae]
MIEADFYFTCDKFDLVMASLRSLPESIVPLRFGSDEDAAKSSGVFFDKAGFDKFLRNSPSGFFLFGKEVVYNVRISIPVELVIEVTQIESEQAVFLLQHLSAEGPIFAFAADSAERDHRNRLVKDASYGVHEAWVGRDWRSYIPGFYWTTIVSQELLERHGVPMEALIYQAVNAREISRGIWQFQFYGEPQDWEDNSVRIDLLCANTAGVFSIENARREFENAKSFLDSSAVLDSWP